MHRLPQGHRAPPAEHVGRAGMAVMIISCRPVALAPGSSRGHLRLAGARSSRRAADNSARRKALGPSNFLRLAHSSAVLQARAAQMVASRETRPEARAFAQKMVEFRREHIPKLEAAARDHQLAVPLGSGIRASGHPRKPGAARLPRAQPALRGDPGPSPGTGSAWVRIC